MALILAVVGALVLGTLGLALLLLSIPWVVSIAAATGPVRRLQIEVRPFSARFPTRLRFLNVAGMVSIDDRTSQKEVQASGASPKAGKPAHSRGGPRRRGQQKAFRMFHAAPRLLKGLLSALRIERLRLRGRIGLSDPADTGQLFGVILPLSFMLPAPRFAVDLLPEFSGPVLDGEAEASLRIHPIRIVPPAVRFGWQVYVRPA